MDLESIILIEISQTEKDKQSMISLRCVIKKKLVNITKKEQIHRYREQTSDYQ